MANVLRALLGKRGRVVELPEVAGARLSLSEVKASLRGTLNEPRTRALLQVMMMRRGVYLGDAQTLAARDQATQYHLGGVKAVEDLMNDLLDLTEGREVTPELKAFFAEG